MRKLVAILLAALSVHQSLGQVKVIIRDQFTGYAVMMPELFCGQLKLERPNEKGELLIPCDTFIVTAPGYRQDTVIRNDQATIKVFLVPHDHLLEEFTFVGSVKSGFASGKLEHVEDMAIFSGKKTDRIDMQQIEGNKAMNVSRQLFSRVAGVNIWESDRAGLQLGIGGRGLSPNRTSNFNTRQNGYDIAADALGYPESYYNPPSEAIREIRVVRGAASLQYGPQFGGMIDFIMNTPPPGVSFEVLSRNTIASWNGFNSFTSIGGNHKRWSAYGYFNHKEGDSWRPNSSFRSNNVFGSFTFRPTARTSVTAEVTHLRYVAQQPGGLTDAQFETDPAQSNRTRNWFDILWNVGAIRIDHKISAHTQIRSQMFGLLAHRKSLGFLGQIQRADPMMERDLIDTRFRNFGNETRILHRYHIDSIKATLLAGVRYYQGYTQNKQGFGDSGNDASFGFHNALPLQSQHSFPSRNVSFFAENLMMISTRLAITPGIRYELIDTRSEGTYTNTITDLAGNIIEQLEIDDNRKRLRHILLAGIGAEIHLNEWMEAYGNFSLNYRAINFNDMRIVNPNFRVDPELQDEKGFSSDIGIRGNLRNILYFDVNAFTVNYANRIGQISMTDPQTFLVYLYRTNIARSISYGGESLLEMSIPALLKKGTNQGDVRLFGNYTFTEAFYHTASYESLNGNRVEFVPTHLLRAGIQMRLKTFSISYQFSYTGLQYGDATNADRVFNAVYGVIPAYAVHDLALRGSYKMVHIETGINNLLNSSYFTRRATAYPGPGIIPADIRNFYVTLQVALTRKKRGWEVSAPIP